MSQIKYHISGTADTTPIKQTGGAIDAMANSGSGLQDTMTGLDGAMRGSTMSIFNLARGVKGLWAAMKAGQMAVPWLMAISVAVMALSKAWTWYKGRQEEAAKSAKKSKDNFDNLISKLRKMREVVEEPLTLDSLNQQLDGLSKHFQTAADKAKLLTDNAAALRNVKLQQDLAAVDDATSGRLTGDSSTDAAVNLAADRRRQEIQTAAELADLEARRADLADQRARAEQQIKYFEGARKTSQTQIQRSAARVRSKEDDVIAARGDPERHIDAVKVRDAAIKDHQKLLDAETQRQKKIDETVAAQREALRQIEHEHDIIQETNKLFEAQRKAREADLALRQKQLAASETDKQRQAEIGALKEKAAAAQKSADAQAEASAARIAQLREIEAKAGAAYAEGRKQITNPAYARQKRVEEREQARDDRRWEAKVARAQRSAARGGRITQDTREILEADRNRRLAGAAGAAAGETEKKMERDMSAAAASLKTIEDKIEQLLSMS